jgi:hypothetical protein
MSNHKEFSQCPFAGADLGNFDPGYLEKGKCIAVVHNKQIFRCCNATANWMVRHDNKVEVLGIRDSITVSSNEDKERISGIDTVLQIAQL